MAPLLSSVEAADFVLARDRLKAAGATVQEAVDYFLLHAAAVREQVLMPELIARFISAKEEAGRSKRGVETLRCALGSLGRRLPLKMAADVTRGDVEAWLRTSGWAAKTKNARRGFASTFFAWGVKRGFCSRNPCDEIEDVREVKEEIGTLTAAECGMLLKCAVRPEHRRMLPYVAIGLFCGLRRAELERLRWEHVNLDESTVIVLSKSAKTRQRRVVDMAPNCVAWLRSVGFPGNDEAVRKRPRVVPSNLKDLWPAFRAAAGLTVWPHNAMRHTFASMHYAMHQNEAQLQVLMGHRSADELHQSYRALKTRREAAEFWALMPPGL
jgi:integrase